MSEKEKELYGSYGIDTDYERALLNYRPLLEYTPESRKNEIDLRSVNLINRSYDFMVSRSILDYRNLLEKLDALLKEIASREKTKEFKEYLNALSTNDLEKTFKIEEENSKYDQTLNYELHTMLYFMRKSIDERIVFLEDNMRTQVSDKTDDEEAMQDEINSIAEWAKLEYDITAAYGNEYYDVDMPEHVQEQIESLEKKKREYEQLHKSLADTSYIHRNRYILFEEIIAHASTLIFNPQEIIEGNIFMLIDQLNTSHITDDIKTHLILSFKTYREKHNALKQKYMVVDDHKERIVSEKNYLYQQISTKTNDKMSSWLYEVPEDGGSSLDLLADILVDSIEKTKKDYETSLADMLSFYKTESSFYGDQIIFIQKKQEIRAYLQIIEDIRDVEYVDDEWIESYMITSNFKL